jgi:hypothetical protein
MSSIITNFSDLQRKQKATRTLLVLILAEELSTVRIHSSVKLSMQTLPVRIFVTWARSRELRKKSVGSPSSRAGFFGLALKAYRGSLEAASDKT